MEEGRGEEQRGGRMTFVGAFLGTISWDAFVGRFRRTLCWDAFVGRFRGTLSWGINVL
jgi:hypothetical protein